MHDTGYTIRCTRIIPPRPGRVGYFQMDPWVLATVIPCQACGGQLLWAEAGYTPGYRICERCGRHWMLKVAAEEKYVEVVIRVPQTPAGPRWSYEDEPTIDEDAYQEYVQQVRQYGGMPSQKQTWAGYQ